MRYTRTGTVGKIAAINEYDGYLYAELDSTGLSYRLDQLIIIHDVEKTAEKKEDAKEEFIRQQKMMSEMQETAWQNTDQSCEGGG